MDFVASLGAPFVAHRLRRLSDRLVESIGAELGRLGLQVPPRSVSTLLLLDAEGPLGPVEIARRLRFSHPLIIRMLSVMSGLNLVEPVGGVGDNRRRRVHLTEQGREEARIIRALNVQLGAVMDQLSREIGADVGALADHLEAALDRQSISRRLGLAKQLTP